MSDIIIHSKPACPACRSVLMAAKYLGIKLDVKNYDLNKGEHLTQEFLEMNPQHIIPTIDDNGFYLWESRAILAYLVNKYVPESAVYPKEPHERAVVDRMLYFDIGTLYKSQMDDLLFPLVFKGHFVDSEKHDAYKKALKLLDDFLGMTPYAAGNHITIADFSLISTLSFAEIFADQFGYMNFEEYPRISAWLKKLKTEIPSYKEINDIPLQDLKDFMKIKFPAIFDK